MRSQWKGKNGLLKKLIGSVNTTSLAKKKTIRKRKETQMNNSCLSLSHDIRSYNHFVCDNPSELKLMLHGDNSFPEDQHATYYLDSFVLSTQNGLERHTEHCQPFPIYIKIFTWPKTFVSGFLLVRWSLSLARERPSRLRRSPNLPSGGPNLPWLFSFPRKKKKRRIAG